MPKVDETRLEIDLKALAHNYQLLAQKLPEQTQIMGVVKAFAYGTDSITIGKKLVDLGATYLAVAYIEEGMRFRRRGIEVPILVFYPQLEDLPKLLEYNLIPSVYNFHFLKKLKAALVEKSIIHFPIHIKINTGMNRLGFDLKDVDELQNELTSGNHFKLEGVFSHLSSAGMPSEDEFTQEQIDKFTDVVEAFRRNVNPDFKAHLCNSSGILSHPEAAFDMVRAGIALYGYGNNPEEQKDLQIVASLKTRIAQLREIPEGASVGYDRKFKAEKASKIATLPLGYADGISRIYGNQKAEVLIHGQKAPIVGNVCMDTLMVDVTEIECQEGDEVLVFGKEHTALDFDKEKQSIPYELITRISQRVTRVVLDDYL